MTQENTTEVNPEIEETSFEIDIEEMEQIASPGTLLSD